MLSRFDRSLYYYFLVGCFAGLTGWFLSNLVQPALLNTGFKWMTSVGPAASMTLVAGLSVAAFERHSFGAGQSIRELAVVALAGLFLGLPVGIIHYGALVYVLHGAGHWSAQLVLGSLLGGGIGIVSSLDIFQPNVKRIGYGLIGGLIGGILGGIAALILGAAMQLTGFSEVADAIGLSLCMVFVCLGSAMAPAFAAQATITYMDSTHDRTQAKYGSANKKWSMVDKKLMIGSHWKLGKSHIYLVDTDTVREFHAVIEMENRRFKLARHEDNAGGELWVDDHRVTGPVPLADGEVIRVGQETRLKFLVGRKGE
jgi:hypothetical protein